MYRDKLSLSWWTSGLVKRITVSFSWAVFFLHTGILIYQENLEGWLVLGITFRCSSQCVPSQVKPSSEDENDEARLHRELGGGEGKGRDNRSSISVMQCGIRLQRHCVHCVGTSSFFLHAFIPSLIWTSTAASPVSLCPFVMLAPPSQKRTLSLPIITLRKMILVKDALFGHRAV